MRGRTILLQLVNLLFAVMPLTGCYRLRAWLLRLAGVKCAKTARIVASTRITMTNVSIGYDTFIGHQVLISGTEACPITIGDNVDIAPRVVIVSGSHIVDMLGARSAGEGKGGDVRIEDGVWIGANSTILAGVTIGRKAVVGAGSVVTRDIPPLTVAVGNPCRPVKKWNPASSTLERIAE